ncbi:MAG: glycosyltransferase family 2 protein [Bdellovibrionales bacterium]|nr:glycosyltransferase family 2 protein [Bdellovibrionales bacterium]
MPYLPGVSIVIPCLNEQRTIQKTVKLCVQVLESLGVAGELIVADNDSRDSSSELAKGAGAQVVEVDIRGYGAALRSGIRAARFEKVVFLDGDLSYPISEIPMLLQPLISGQADLVLGSRLKGSIQPGAMPFLNRYLGTPILSFLIRLLFRIPVSDSNSGMRAISRDAFETLQLKCQGMEFASEMLVRAAQQKIRYTEVPISFFRDQRNGSSHLNRWADGFRHLLFILRAFFRQEAFR